MSSGGLQFRVGTLSSATESQLSAAITMKNFMQEKIVKYMRKKNHNKKKEYF